MRLVIDKFVGDPAEFYRLVVEEVKERELPEVEFGWNEEVEHEKRFFDKGVKLTSLRIKGKHQISYVLAVPVGNCFFVSVRDHRMGSAPDSYVYGVFAACFHTTVARSVRKALTRHMEAQSVPIPSFLTASDNSSLADSAA